MTMPPMGAEQGHPEDQLRAYAEMVARENGIDPKRFAEFLAQRSGNFDPSGYEQLAPKYHPGVDTSDPLAMIESAALFLADQGDGDAAYAAWDSAPASGETPPPAAPPSGPRTAGATMGGHGVDAEGNPLPQEDTTVTPLADGSAPQPAPSPSPAGAGTVPVKPLTSVPAGPQPSPLSSAQPGRGKPAEFRDLLGSGIIARPLGSVPNEQLSPLEAQGYFPFSDPSMGGPGQAAFNLITGMGMKPNLGNPWVNFLMGKVGPMWDQYQLDQELKGNIPNTALDENAASAAQQTIQGALQSGHTQLVNPLEMVQRLRDLATGEVGEDPNGARWGLQAQLQNPASARAILEKVLSLASNPFLKQYLGPALDQREMLLRQKLPQDPNLNPFSFLSGGA